MRLGILGGGQLAWMLAQAAEPLGVSVAVLDPSPDCAAGRISDHVVAAYDDPAGLDEVSKGADVVIGLERQYVGHTSAAARSEAKSGAASAR
jgi:5-(carboxyamino)imidazole ribonucleotide synthase